MSHPPARSDLHCRNCGAVAALNFCPHCGQETALHPPTLGEFVHEFVGHYVALEGALWRTLRLLLLRPGQLTREYLAGRKRRYVLPLRLYLTASFIFFLLLKLLPSTVNGLVVFDPPVLPGDAVVHRAAPATSGGSAASDASDASASSASGAAPGVQAAASNAASAPVRGLHVRRDGRLRPVDCGEAGQDPCGLVSRVANRIGQRVSNDPEAVSEHVRSRLVGVAPYAVFLLLPLFAGLVALAYRRRRMTYGEHVVFSLHLHAFWFLALLLVALLPDFMTRPLLWTVPIYGVWAMHTVYRGSWGMTLLRAGVASLVYGCVLVLVTAGLVLAALVMT